MQQHPLYVSTRGGEKDLTFRQVVLKGLADDGGLFVPSSVPSVNQAQMLRWRNLSYTDLAFAILSLFISEDDVPRGKLKEIISKSYQKFFVPDALKIHTIVQQTKGGSTAPELLHVCELFHGPTFSFKDFALQFLGNLFEYLLMTNQTRAAADAVTSKGGDTEGHAAHITVLGATSGDTGSAGMFVPTPLSLFHHPFVLFIFLFLFHRLSLCYLLLWTNCMQPWKD